VTTVDLTELEWTVNHISVRPVLSEWAAAVEIDAEAIDVIERGTEVNLDAETVVGWVRFHLLDASFVAYFGPDRMTTAWLETTGAPEHRKLFGPVTSWTSLQEAARQAEAAEALH
jgi:hypothetical protein